MKRLPSGVSDFEKLIVDCYYYVDKTSYIERLENYSNPNIIFLRPRKFGKTLFTSTLENYYDVQKVDKFDKLFGETYIGKNPTKAKNSYHILKFNFSGINTNDYDSTIQGFKRETVSSIDLFIKKYNLDFYVNEADEAEGILDNLFKAFSIQKNGEKIYVIIDEYDHFANELLGFSYNDFKDLVSKNGKVRKWYEILKKGTESVVDRIFITGVAPITLDSMTSGFNIAADITRDLGFSSMMGFNEYELVELMKAQNISEYKIKELIPIMKENYDGYRFSEDADKKLYNSNMSLYFLNEYVQYNKLPKKMLDVNIASDYKKIANILNLCHGERRLEILSNVVSGEGIVSSITDKFNPEIEFGEKEMVSMLFYLGYLTIGEVIGAYPKLMIPNRMMTEIYSQYFLAVLQKEFDVSYESTNYEAMTMEAAFKGKIDIILEILKKYLTNLSNRDYQKFDEKYIKLIFYCIAMNMEMYSIKSEPEFNRNYPDLLLVPKDLTKDYYAIMIEFKYLKKSEKSKLNEKQKEAREQIKEYAEFEEIKKINNLKKFAVVAVVDDIHVEEIE